ncbi:hypothetical protein GCM10009555_039610 [Acrocarpospora macrocephala]|uniref:Histidine kinase/HSP90-like ATPase domain-containing protein n=1 Tax=Acrocarpospora macrocephala TaxID=150177 RepID=A0A5M3WKS3_9ACTN|nr:ATP-binding protein [Acrocarpospora macrocephala]GES09847.1 hypothetical protein Amac_034430 [Acrocarpospora macrocephala]
MAVEPTAAGRFDDRLRYAVLLVSELVSNALRHSDSGRDPDGKITVQVADVDGHLHISVLDQGSASSVPYLVPDSGGGRGSRFGLRIVAEFASEWGHEYYGEGRRMVWFDLAPPLVGGQEAGWIGRGELVGGATATQRVATCPQLMLGYGISRWTAGRVLSRLTGKGYAYNAHRRGTRAAAFDRWPPPGTSMEQPPPPDDHVPASRPRLASGPDDQGARLGAVRGSAR